MSKKKNLKYFLRVNLNLLYKHVCDKVCLGATQEHWCERSEQLGLGAACRPEILVINMNVA